MPIIGEKNGQVASFGTAFLIAPYLALTAMHVLEEYAKWDNIDLLKEGSKTNLTTSLYLLNVAEDNQNLEVQTFLPNEYTKYKIKQVIKTSKRDDVALLILHNKTNLKNYPVLDFRPPKVGEQLWGMGFPATQSNYMKMKDTRLAIALGMNPKITEGYVSDTFPNGINPSFLGATVWFRTEGGMSGGPVLSKSNGYIKGLITDGQNHPDEHGNYVSRIATLGSILKISVDDKNIVGYLSDLGLEHRNSTDYRLDSISGELVYQGPHLDDLVSN
jgi:Trypsin-like peptidase domain